MKEQIFIKFLIIFVMALGFLVSIAVPKLAILRLGELNYGIFALITGFAGVLAFSDMGIIPGLTKQLAHPVSIGDLFHVNKVLNKVTTFAVRLFIGLSVISSIIFFWIKPSLENNDIYAFALFLLATIFVILAEIRLSVLRVSGHIRESYYLKIIYLVTYFSTVLLFYLILTKWSSVLILCFAQFVAAIVYFYGCLYWVRNKISWSRINKSESEAINQNFPDVWRLAWKTSSPERYNRFLQLFIGIVERPLLVMTAGLAVVGSYDLLLRITLLVSALPSALNQPLLSMILHDSVRDEKNKKFLKAFDLTKLLSIFLAVVGVVAATTIITFFHESIFGVTSRIPSTVSFLIICVAAINVLTASGSALFVARGIIWPCNLKIAIESVGTIGAVVVAFFLSDGMLFIIIRSLSQGLSALVFLVFEKQLKVIYK